MKCTVPEIAWHNRDPVLSVDFQHTQGRIHRLVTGGTDCHVVIWYAKIDNLGEVNLELASDLRRHNKAVNVVRFSPSGEFLASGDDEAVIWIWKKSDKDVNPGPDLFNDDDVETNQEQWTSLRMLRGHIEDVYDLCWSPDSLSLISGSVDNSAILWDVNKGKKTTILSDHKGFVQGVAWDPLNKYVATLCSDRSCRIYNIGSLRTSFRLQKTTVAVQSSTGAPQGQTGKNEGDVQTTRSLRLFHDDTLKSFCRRLTFSPDGQMLITPSGIFENDNGTVSNVTYIFSRTNLGKPALYLPVNDKSTVAVRCCPVLFQLRTSKDEKSSDSSMFKLPYRMVFAVATQDSVFFYDTQQHPPFGHVSNIHYTRLSDLTWSRDGRIVVVSSTDGYCSIITFNEGELGEPYDAAKRDQVNANVPPVKPASAPTKPSATPLPVPPTNQSAKPALDPVETHASSPAKAETTKSSGSVPVASSPAQILPVPASSLSSPVPSKPVPTSATTPKQHKRVAFITLSSPKSASSEKTSRRPVPAAFAKTSSSIIPIVDLGNDSALNSSVSPMEETEPPVKLDASIWLSDSPLPGPQPAAAPMEGTDTPGKLDASVWLSDSPYSAAGPLSAQKKDDLPPSGGASDDDVIAIHEDATNSDHVKTSDSHKRKTILILDSPIPDVPRSPTTAKPLAELLTKPLAEPLVEENTPRSSDPCTDAVQTTSNEENQLTRELAKVTVGNEEPTASTASVATIAAAKPQADFPTAIGKTSGNEKHQTEELPDVAAKVTEGDPRSQAELVTMSGGAEVAAEIGKAEGKPDVPKEANPSVAGVPVAGQARPPRRVPLITLCGARKP